MISNRTTQSLKQINVQLQDFTKVRLEKNA